MTTPRSRPSDERGIALALAVFALVVIGALVAGIFLAGRLEARSGTNTILATKAAEAAEAGAVQTLATWNTTVYNALPVGDSAMIGRTSLGTSGTGLRTTYQAKVKRLSNSLFLVASTGEQFSAGGVANANLLATRTVGLLARLMTVTLSASSAVTSRGNVQVGGSSQISGTDQNPLNWLGCGTTSDKAGIRTNGTVDVKGSATVAGSPPLQQHDSTVVDSVIRRPFNQLKQYANIKLPAGNYNGLVPTTYSVTAPTTPPTTYTYCDTRFKGSVPGSPNNPYNWGEPYVGLGYGGTPVIQCQGYFPVIYIGGDVSLQTGRGQGILLVDGDLDVRGNFEFTGIILVMGQVKSNGTGNKIVGTLMADNVDLGDQTSFNGNPTVNFSSCAVEKALLNAAVARPLADRSWVQLYNTYN